MLEKRGQIVVQKTHLTTIITIVNYERYQSNGEQTVEQTVEQTGSRLWTNKNDKNDKNDKNYVSGEKEYGQQPDGYIIGDKFIQDSWALMTKCLEPRRPFTMTEDRRKKFVARLREYNLEDLEEVWLSMAKDPFLQGKNDRMKKYLTADYALNSKKIEMFFNSVND